MTHTQLLTQIDAAYEEALNYLYSLINLERNRIDRYTASKLDITRPARLMAFLGHPQKAWPSVHIAGTKGKGSVAAMCAASLRAAGLKVGLYTSPHVREFRERIRVLTPEDPDGRISEADFVELMAEIKTAVSHIPDLTWFEAVTGLAFRHFAREQVDIAVIEVGLGGRLDATNVITPLVSVITSLSLDHTELLGNTLTEIAWEKGGIIKPGIPVVIAPQKPEAIHKLREIAHERNAPLITVGQDWQYDTTEQLLPDGRQLLTLTHTPPTSLFTPPTTLTLALAGAHQMENGTVALAALEQIRPYFPTLNKTAIQEGLATVSWIGRLQTIHQSPHTPTLLVDCAHNPDAIAKLCHALTHNFRYNNLHLIFGAPTDKDTTHMLEQLLPLTTPIIFTTANHPPSASP
ncbi:MAG: bifunctional folylpolyglutamate synthase/dihydrofolate synthase, partial [Chloroflexi bacterium]